MRNTKDIRLLFTPENRDLVRRGLKTETRRTRGLTFADDPAQEWRLVDTFASVTKASELIAHFEGAASGSRLVSSPYGNPQSSPVRYWLAEPVQILTLNDGTANSPLPWVELIYLDDGDAATPQACEITFEDRHNLIARKDWRKPSTAMFMLKSFTRTWFRGIKVWPEQLGDMTDESCIAEGIQAFDYGPDSYAEAKGRNVPVIRYGLRKLALGVMEKEPIEAYRRVWQGINGPNSWDDERWVWATRFGPPLTMEHCREPQAAVSELS